MEIKPKEVIVSLAIIAVMMILGIGIGNRVQERLLEKYQEYDSAVKIDSEELFRYGMKTSIGHAFVYGKLKTLDPVGFPEIQGQYSYIKKEEQEYRKHEKTVRQSYTDENGETKTREVKKEYWTWDTMYTETKTAKRISFLNVEFAYGKVPFPSSSYITTINTGYHRRNEYYGTGTEFQGTVYTTLKENTINNTSFYKSLTIDKTIEQLESGYEIIIFWLIWILLTAGCVVGFYFLKNKWLD